ncbi:MULTISPECIES: type II toxin-antitoxin system VapC family toxin [unclassified Sphingomonas]|uniref:type II toxin-antitoxin system VapC family toxin n=1 Tax=unclassified Sphingomonas TaxID=196159 RepID=UPI00082B5199|nr:MULTISPECIES: PIN domain nuclease [unclassified Sphingomonas]
MIVVDSSVWIDALRGNHTRAVAAFQAMTMSDEVLVGDLVLMEVLQGIREDKLFEAFRRDMQVFPVIEVGGEEIAIAAARNYRILRAKGVTVRKTIDTLIATRCIRDGLALLYSDRDFDPFVEHLGLIPVLDPASGVN